ncbi:VCBS repeat-containing protein [Streptomyces sp. ASQP_92]|uniref:FG-GAP repeat domain-containing protein n=1 Tax=Streptomyces sp. ASQP_92 TaxID=2979116 RepID=UPI0021BF3536|nr:VCBS repeat-containing protein [Streptomyces sp. ASQP_92]MCT9093393.1 VCBS repeat-containing protein [Streptomyces sp. ASQP_92]
MHPSAIPSRTRSPRSTGGPNRLVTAATLLALAVTAGPLASPALAAPPVAPTASGAAPASRAATFKIAADAEVLSAGRTGFLSIAKSGSGHDVLWTRYADGHTTVVLKDAPSYASLPSFFGTSSDMVAVRDDAGTKVTLLDMTTGSSNVVDLASYGYFYLGTVGSHILAYKRTGDTVEPHVLDVVDQKVTDRVITGLPAGVREVDVEAGSGDFAALRYTISSTNSEFFDYIAADLSSAKVVTGNSMLGGYITKAAVSATHLALAGGVFTSDTSSSVRTMELGGDQKRWDMNLDRKQGDGLVGLVGGWSLYGENRRLNEGNNLTDSALRATPIGGGTERTVMDHASSAAPAPDGSLLVMGGTSAEGEGLYRISAGADGAPVAQLLSGTGHPTKLIVEESQVPAVAALDNAPWRPKWRLTHSNTDVTVTLRHTASGAQREIELRVDPAQWESTAPAWRELDWDGLMGPSYSPNTAAPNGGYTWTLTAKPRNGIGPDLIESGAFTVSRKAAPHDFTDNGSPDLLIRSGLGTLWRTDTYREPGTGQLKGGEAQTIGSDWDIYNQVTAVGDVAGASGADAVARDKDGVLWLYLGKGDGTFDSRVRIGSGWGAYNQLTGGGDVSGDGRSDLLARDAQGVLWLYKGTGNWRAPFAPRVKAGTGWDMYNQVTAVGDVAGGPGGDLVGRDKDGVSWLYLGKGDGTFDSRVRIGEGWGAYNQTVGIGDSDSDGRADLFVTTSTGDSYVYRGTGNWRAPFAAREQTGLSRVWSDETIS